MSLNSPELNAATERRLASLKELTALQLSHFFRLSKRLAFNTRSVASPNAIQYDSPWYELELCGNEGTVFLASMARFSRRPFRPRVAELYVPRLEPPYLGYPKCIARFDAEAERITEPSATGDVDILPESDAWRSLYTKLSQLEDIPFTTIIGHTIVQNHQPAFNPLSPHEYYGY